MNRAKVLLLWLLVIALQFSSIHLQRLPQECGRSLHGLITRSGGETQVFEHPWMALLWHKRRGASELENWCTGSLINERYVLTTDWCINAHKYTALTLVEVHLGEHDRNRSGDCNIKRNDAGVETERECAGPVEVYGMESTVAHPDLDPDVPIDIGLIRLDRKVTFKDHIRPICLPVTAELRFRKIDQFVEAGWRLRQEPSSDVLLSQTLPYPNETCKNLVESGGLYKPHSKEICLDVFEMKSMGKRTYGDRGSPLGSFVNCTGDDGSRRFVQFGIRTDSITFHDSFTGNTLYTRVASYMEWILENIKA